MCVIIVSALVFGPSAVAVQNRPRNTQPAPKPAATATPTPAPATTPQRGGQAPTLGEPPPVPKLKPTPTPEPPADIGEGETIRINADLVQLHVRVIDRNNRPINNVRKEEFHICEDGVAQPIESFTREEVPI